MEVNFANAVAQQLTDVARLSQAIAAVFCSMTLSSEL
jgi:hypothetical protein